MAPQPTPRARRPNTAGWVGAAVVLLLLSAIASWAVGNVAWTGVRAQTNTPAGTYSDFAARWLGTGAILRDGQSPYSPALGPAIQQLYYGRVIAPDEPDRPVYPQGFYYPLYLVWLIAPLALLPFPLASAVFKLLAVGLLVAGAYGYTAILGWPSTRPARLALSLGAVLLPAGQLVVRLDQPTALVYGLIMGTLYAIWRERYDLAGVLLALAWIKPQVAAPLTLGLLIWALVERTRWRLLVAGAGTGALLLGSSLLLLPGWIGQWLDTLNEYATVTGGTGAAAPAGVDWGGLAGRGVLVAGVIPLWWGVRRAAFGSGRVQLALAGTLLITVLIQQPWYFTYNELLLYPVLLLLLAALFGPGRDLPPPPRLLAGLTLALAALPGLINIGIALRYLSDLVAPPPAVAIAVADLTYKSDTIAWAFLLLGLVFTLVVWGLALRGRPPVAATRPAE